MHNYIRFNIHYLSILRVNAFLIRLGLSQIEITFDMHNVYRLMQNAMVIL